MKGSRNKSTTLVVSFTRTGPDHQSAKYEYNKNRRKNSELRDYHADHCVCDHSWRRNNTVRPENSPA